ncbi:CDP-glycerol glycerophosphotransferase family protein [Lacisediminihabitans profunda]|uniref:Glycosyl/glycerophosphate transferase n=1 Tax=Lacisediminihabitans profunda TaxID=2594790 RepID=A0A5C8UTP0_9MICO|nr:CDP-glycerol glycerophosphotransferase family protein [Lacisediminihabitans profunda]TXN31280.1 glycosyl/glycerophosphate transferase [Lacisediminihabitans profunda]
MPGFNFASGNAKKLLSLPLYALGALASLAVPRSDDRWVVGCGSGVGEGALELFLLARAKPTPPRLAWLARDDRELADARALGLDATLKSSARGLWLTLRARVLVVTHGFGDVNRYGTRGGFVVQLWHGIPLKLIQLDSPATMRTRLPGARRLRGPLRRAYRAGFDGISFMPAASPLAADRLRTAFGLPASRIAVTGDPRDDVLSRGTPAERSARARELLFARLRLPPTDSTIILFAPTWRDGEADPGIPSADDWLRIDEYLLASDSVLVLRPHPHGVGDYRGGVAASDRVVLLDSTGLADVTPVLPAVDVLITDYSSIALDYSLTGGPILFLAPDEESYSESRGFYEPYREFSGGREVRTWSALLGQLRRLEDDPAWAGEVRAHSADLATRHFTFQDGRNAERVYSEIVLRQKARK